MKNNLCAFGVALILCLFARQAQAQVNCTTAGRFADTSDLTCKNYTYCVYDTATASFLSYNYVCPSTSVFNPNTNQCSTNYVCANTTTDTNTTSCTTDGFIADPTSTDCSTYLQCVQLTTGLFSETTLPCPTDTFFDPTTTLCETNYTCTTNFTCTAPGRFADTTDTTCQTYFYCVFLSMNSTYVQYQYTCPSTSVFSPTRNLCTTTYTCPTV